MRHHCQRQSRQYRPQQGEVILAEALSAVGREGIGDAGSARGVALRPETDDLGEVVGRAVVGELFENRKIGLRFGPGQTPTQMSPRIAASALGSCLANEIGERARQPNLTILVVAVEL